MNSRMKDIVNYHRKLLNDFITGDLKVCKYVLVQVSPGSQFSRQYSPFSRRNQSARGSFLNVRLLPPPGPGTEVLRVYDVVK